MPDHQRAGLDRQGGGVHRRMPETRHRSGTAPREHVGSAVRHLGRQSPLRTAGGQGTRAELHCGYRLGAGTFRALHELLLVPETHPRAELQPQGGGEPHQVRCPRRPRPEPPADDHGPAGDAGGPRQRPAQERGRADRLLRSHGARSGAGGGRHGAGTRGVRPPRPAGLRKGDHRPLPVRPPDAALRVPVR